MAIAGFTPQAGTPGILGGPQPPQASPDIRTASAPQDMSAPAPDDTTSGPSVFNADRIAQLRKTMPDDTIYQNAYQMDPTFKQKADMMQPFVAKQNQDWQKTQYPSWMLNQHYGMKAPKASPLLAAVGANATKQQSDLSLPTFSQDDIFDHSVGQSPLKAITSPFKIAANMGADAVGMVRSVIRNPKSLLLPVGAVLFDYNALASKVGLPQVDPGGLSTMAGEFANSVADSYGLKDAVQGDFKTASDKFEKTFAEHPFQTYLMGKMAQQGVAGGLQLGSDAMQGSASSVPLDSPAASLGRAGQAVQNFNPAAPLEALGKAAYPAASAVGKSIAGGLGGMAKYGTSLASGLEPQTMSTIVNNPSQFAAAQRGDLTINSLGSRVQDAISSRLQELSGLGKEYQAVRQSGQLIETPPEGIMKIFAKYGVGFDAHGNVDASNPDAIPMEPGDIRSVQQFMDRFGNKESLTANGLLNARTELSNMADFGADKSSASTLLAKGLRSYYDGIAKEQIPGLADLDAKYAPEVKFLNDIKSEYLNTDGTLKDGALSKIANVTGQNKSAVLSRLEELVPGVGQDVRVLKALNDVTVASGNKIGTYTRSAVMGGGIATGNVPAIVGSIMTSPQVVVPLLKWFGDIMGNSDQTEGVITKLQAGAKLNEAQAALVSTAISKFDALTSGGLKAGTDSPPAGSLSETTSASPATLPPQAAEGQGPAEQFATSLPVKPSPGVEALADYFGKSPQEIDDFIAARKNMPGGQIEDEMAKSFGKPLSPKEPGGFNAKFLAKYYGKSSPDDLSLNDLAVVEQRRQDLGGTKDIDVIRSENAKHPTAPPQ